MSYDLNDPKVIGIGDFAKTIHCGDFSRHPIKAWYVLNSSEQGTPEEIEIVEAYNADDSQNKAPSYFRLSDGKHITSLYVFPAEHKPIFVEFVDDYGIFHNWASIL